VSTPIVLVPLGDPTDELGEVPRPTLLGAIVTKAAACGLPGDMAAQHGRPSMTFPPLKPTGIPCCDLTV
jgi:hypothetical protein